MSANPAEPWSHADFEARLRAIGTERYHDKHPFNLRMHEGRLSREEVQTWVRNRYCYQTRIPLKDSAILAKSGDSAFRREWVQRLHDHDGRAPGEGGLELWLRLGGSRRPRARRGREPRLRAARRARLRVRWSPSVGSPGPGLT